MSRSMAPLSFRKDAKDFGQRGLADSHRARRWTMNGFALYFRAKIRLKYDCRNLPKKSKKCSPLREKRKGNSAMDRKEALSTQPLALSQNQHQRPFTTKDTEDTEKGKSTTQQRAEALVKKIGEACDELERLA